jgi:nucleotide-binding universal stress UspA family protein
MCSLPVMLIVDRRRAMTRTEAVIVVGVEGVTRSEAADAAAIELGVWEAARRRIGLHLVCGQPTLPRWHQTGPAAGDGTPARPGQMLDRIVDRTTVAHPGIVVTGTEYSGGLAGAITVASAAAGLAIVTADSRVRYGGLLAGLVSIQVVTHARTSVIVVPAPDSRRPAASAGRVVVGVDGSPGSADAVGFAFDEAQARGARLDAMYVCEPSTRHLFVPAFARDTDPDPLHTAAGRMLREATAPWEDKYPDVAVVHDVVRGDNPVRALDDAGVGVELIVVGRRGHGGFDGLLLGSVSDGLVRYSRHTIAVVRSDAAG